MSDPTEKPELHFFRTTPADLLGRPPLASSLQSFESCLFLIGLARYPHAFIACTAAIESGIKAAFNIAPEGRDSFQTLLARARGEKPTLGVFPEQNINNLRLTRNRVVHYGFSPKDDKLTALLLLESAVPFLAAFYEAYFQFDLCDGLHADFGAQLRNALRAFQGLRQSADQDPTLYFRVLGHLVRWSVKGSFMSDWETEAADDAEAHGLKFEVVEQRRQEVERLLEPAWSFDCPICHGIQALICQMVEQDLDERRVAISRALCLECGLVVPKDAAFLADAICHEQVEKKREEILREFGIS